MKLESLRDLLVEQLQDLHDAENRITKALPKMAKAATSPELKAAFEKHLRETKGHVTRLEQAFETLGEKAKKKTCQAVKGLIEEGEETIKEDAEPEVKDAALIAAAQRVEHYEMAGYGTVCTYAKQGAGRRQALERDDGRGCGDRRGPERTGREHDQPPGRVNIERAARDVPQ
jgi:ferritin-like metal-binding protein YciE